MTANRKPAGALFGALLLLAITGCENGRTDLRLARPESPVDAAIIETVAALLESGSEIRFRVSETEYTDEAALDALAAGSADLALVSNNVAYREDVSTVLPMYPTVLHVGHFGRLEPDTGADAVRGARVFAGSAGSAARLMLDNYAAHEGLDAGDFIYVDGEIRTDQPPDLFVVFAPISPDRLSHFQAQFPELRLVSLGSPEEIGTGADIDRTTLLNPQLEPFVIPVGTYGDATPAPVLTLAVDTMLVARPDLSPSVVYDLVRELRRMRPALASQRPGLFRSLGDEIDTRNSTFVLHPGLVAYVNRNEPSVYERYSGVAEVVVTLVVALFSATFAGVRIYHMRRKNRIDTFYTDVMAVRRRIDQTSPADARAAAKQEIRRLQDLAVEMLVDEKLSADESFRIFMSLSNDALAEIEAGGKGVW